MGMTPLHWPDEIDAGEGVVLRRPDPIDAEAITQAIVDSLDELRPWMPWAQEPPDVDQQAVRLAIVGESFAAGGDAAYTVFLGDDVIGTVGIHDRVEPDAREIGYWLRTGWTGRGLMTRAVAALAKAAFDAGVERIEIHCDEANRRSAAIPRRLGFTHVATIEEARTAPADTNRTMVWELVSRNQRR
jgi:RimJ/RimL family protein N-acetyltransferase